MGEDCAVLAPNGMCADLNNSKKKINKMNNSLLLGISISVVVCAVQRCIGVATKISLTRWTPMVYSVFALNNTSVHVRSSRNTGAPRVTFI